MVTISGWIKMKKIKYLQDRNPGVPGLIYKLEPEKDKERKLENVRKLWDCVIDINGVGFKRYIFKATYREQICDRSFYTMVICC